MQHPYRRSLKRGMIEIPLTPAFITVLAVGVALILLSRIYLIGTSAEYLMQFFATDYALLVDGVLSQKQSVDLAVQYPAPETYAWVIEPGTVKVSLLENPAASKEFYFTEEPLYVAKHRTFKPPFSPLTVYRTGNLFGFAKKDETPLLDLPTCPRLTASRLQQVQLGSTSDAAGVMRYLVNYNPRLFAGGKDALIQLDTSSTNTIEVHTNAQEESALLACLIVQSMLLNPQFQGLGWQIVPVNPDHLPPNHPHEAVARFAGPAVSVAVPEKLTEITVAGAIFKGVDAYG